MRDRNQIGTREGVGDMKEDGREGDGQGEGRKGMDRKGVGEGSCHEAKAQIQATKIQSTEQLPNTVVVVVLLAGEGLVSS